MGHTRRRAVFRVRSRRERGVFGDWFLNNSMVDNFGCVIRRHWCCLYEGASLGCCVCATARCKDIGGGTRFGLSRGVFVFKGDQHGFVWLLCLRSCIPKTAMDGHGLACFKGRLGFYERSALVWRHCIYIYFCAVSCHLCRFHSSVLRRCFVRADDDCWVGSNFDHALQQLLRCSWQLPVPDSNHQWGQFAMLPHLNVKPKHRTSSQ
jgi:hypothetical protein